MTNFDFRVDEAYARKHNEFLRDAKRLQISAGILAAILIAVIAIVFSALGATVLSIGLAVSLGFFALLCLILIPVLPKKMGDPQRYYDMYQLAPAVVAEVNARDMVILAYIDASAEEGTSAPALVCRTVTSIPGVAREVGSRVPSMVVTGYRPTRGPKVYEEVSPMPVAWGTPDEKVWKDAERAIPTNQWKRLEELQSRLGEVKKTPRDLLILDRGALKKRKKRG